MNTGHRARTVFALLATALAVLIAQAGANPVAAASSDVTGSPTATVGTPGHPLVLAHYYIWFNHVSWRRAKQDYPAAGTYSSDDANVMRLQIQQAKSAGIDGFIVSWKSTPVLNARLQTLIKVAHDEHFKLAITYQGLTFDRVNLPAARVAADLDVFIHDFAANSVFDLYGKPLVVLTGTPGMTVHDLAEITATRRSKLLILATEKNSAGYERVAPLFDGDLYYWSSVNPATFNGYAAKLASMAAAVRAHSGIWIAPAAPGFDARLVGGKSVVPRDDGATLRAEWNAALASLPNAIGIISWNEYSENTYIEPSRRYGDAFVNEVRALTGAQAPAISNVDSSEPAGAVSPWRPAAVFAGVLALLVWCSVLAVRRRRLMT